MNVASLSIAVDPTVEETRLSIHDNGITWLSPWMPSFDQWLPPPTSSPLRPPLLAQTALYGSTEITRCTQEIQVLNPFLRELLGFEIQPPISFQKHSQQGTKPAHSAWPCSATPFRCDDLGPLTTSMHGAWAPTLGLLSFL